VYYACGKPCMYGIGYCPKIFGVKYNPLGTAYTQAIKPYYVTCLCCAGAQFCGANTINLGVNCGPVPTGPGSSN